MLASPSPLTTSLLLCLASELLTEEAFAAGPIGEDGEAIATSDYAIDLYQGSVFAGARVTGMAGAHVAIAEDVDGDLQNPATPANRPFFSVSHFDWWLGLGVTFPGALSKMDFFNSSTREQPHTAPEKLIFVTPAMNLQWGPWGLGATVEFSSYGFETAKAGGDSLVLDVNTGTTHIQLARSFVEGQLAVGLGVRTLVMGLGAEGESNELFSSSGSGLEAGLLLRPTGQPFRLGAAFRSAITTEAQYRAGLLPDESGDIVLQGPEDSDIYVPDRVSLPWDVNVGGAYQWGRPFNLGWRKAHIERNRLELLYQLLILEREEERSRRLEVAGSRAEIHEIEKEMDALQKVDERQHRVRMRAIDWDLKQELADMKRLYLLVSASLVVSGTAASAVGIESFLNQTVHRSGEKVVISPRLGMESELWPDILKLRAGSYLEPARFESSHPRVHGTAGLDLRLIRWSVLGIGPSDYLWKLKLSADVAERYFTWGIMIGGWYPRHSGKIPEKVRGVSSP